MLLKISDIRGEKKLAEFADLIKVYGRKTSTLPARY